MRRSPLAAVLAVATVIALAGCATAPAAKPDPTPPAPTPTPTPTPTTTVESMVVGPAESPPVAFGGDCTRVLEPDDIAEVMGMSVEPATSEPDPVLGANVGSLWCSWASPQGSVRLTVIPQAGLDGATFPADSVKYYFEDCDTDWVCGWQGGDSSIWIGMALSHPEMTRESVDAWGSALGERITGNHEAVRDEPWVRDRTGWWPTFTCEQIAAAVGAQLGAEVTGEFVGYIDPPAPGMVMADVASRHVQCMVSAPQDVGIAVLSTRAGTAASAPASPAVALGIPGITAATISAGYYLGGQGFSITDGTNVVWLEAASAGGWSEQQIATAIAAAAASGFQL